MVINHNLASQNALRNTNINSSNASKSMEKLSSGLRINRAGDDAAGLAISEKMRAQVRGLDQASANAQDGVSMIQTAEGGLSETHSILQRMRELAVQASNDTNVAVDRSEIQKEMDELTKEVTRISNNTEFNTQKLINGGITDDGIGSAKFHIGANANQDITLSINAMDAKSLGITRDVKAGSIDTSSNTAKIDTISADSVDVSKTLQDGKYKVVLDTKDAGATSATDSSGETIDDLVTGTATADTNITLTFTDHGTAARSTAATAIAAAGNNMGDVTSIKLNGANVKLTNTAGVTNGTEADVVTALQRDIDSALGSNKYTVSVDPANHQLSISSVATGAATKVDLSGSDIASATKLGFTGALTAATGSATGGTTNWVATGSLGGVVSASNNTVNGITIDVAELDNTVPVGEKITIKGFKDATLSAQLQSVGTGLTLTQSANAGATDIEDAITGTATRDTNVKLTYSTGAATATEAVGNTATITDAAIGGVATAATEYTLTRTEIAATAGTLTGTNAIGGNAVLANAGNLVIKVDGGADITAAVAVGDNIDNIVSKINAASVAAGGANNIASKDATNHLVLTSDTADATSTVSIEAGSAAGTLTYLGLTSGATGTGSAALEAWVATGDVTGTQVEDSVITVNNSTFNLDEVNGAAVGDVITIKADAVGWHASGDRTGILTGAVNDINGINVDITQIAGVPINGETINISSTTTQDIGKAVTVDQKNGGNYVLGDADVSGQLKIGIKAGTAVKGSTTVNLTTSEAASASKQADGTMSNATAVGGLDVSTQSKASAAVTTLQSAIEKVSAERSKLGAYQNRLEHTMANLGTSSENLTAAESRIRDVDMAKEMSAYSKNNILAQAAQSMLAQANQKPQQVLQLLQ